MQLSGRREQLFIARSLEPPCRVIVGGYPASTHYARLRWMDVDIRLGTELWMHGKFFLPRDFYTRHESYMRVFMWLDNFNLDSTNPRRLELVMYGSDQLLRIMRQRQSREETQLWRYDGRLPLGKAFHLAAHYILSQTDGEALSELYIDGERVGSSTMANVTAGDASSARFTRAAFGIGGAAGQDGTTIELRMADLGVTRTKPN